MKNLDHALRIHVLAALAIVAQGAAAAGGPLGIDHRVNFDDSGIWRRGTQRAVEHVVVAATLATALWQGDDSRLGHTAWQAVDALAIG